MLTLTQNKIITTPTPLFLDVVVEEFQTSTSTTITSTICTIGRSHLLGQLCPPCMDGSRFAPCYALVSKISCAIERNWVIRSDSDHKSPGVGCEKVT